MKLLFGLLVIMGLLLEGVFFWPLAIILWLARFDQLGFLPGLAWSFGLGLARDVMAGATIGYTSLILVITLGVVELLRKWVSFERNVVVWLTGIFLVVGFDIVVNNFIWMWLVLAPGLGVLLRRFKI